MPDFWKLIPGNMRLVTAFIFLTIINLILSCNSKPAESSTEAEIASTADSLMSVWNVSWSNGDTATIAKIFSPNTHVVFSPEERLISGDSIMMNWVRRNLPSVRNLRTTRFTSGGSENLVYYSGTYMLDVVRNDSVVGADVGSLTAIWSKQPDLGWKMELLFFGNK